MVVNVEYLGKITASKDVLCAISLAFQHEQKYYESCGREWLASQARARGNSIHDALDRVGYYDNVK